MKYKLLTLCIIWFGVSVFWVIIFSVQDKEWWIGQGEIKNICDLVYYIEEDDSRNTGIIFSLPVFFPAVYAIFIKKITTGLSGSPHWLLLVTGYGNFLSVTSFVCGNHQPIPVRFYPWRVRFAYPPYDVRQGSMRLVWRVRFAYPPYGVR
ncbi:DUF2645 family protein [Cronobacter sakazakii]|uniref:DUF2645 family protein n=3 Tax=Cronobacter sakazakii TaxID=28141 RepID=UPI003B982FEF